MKVIKLARIREPGRRNETRALRQRNYHTEFGNVTQTYDTIRRASLVPKVSSRLSALHIKCHDKTMTDKNTFAVSLPITIFDWSSALRSALTVLP